ELLNQRAWPASASYSTSGRGWLRRAIQPAGWRRDVTASEAGVGVHPLEEEVHDREVEDHGRETDDREPRGRCTAPSAGRPGVDVAGEDDPDDERPHLLGVPAPVATPGVLGPDGTGDEGEGPECKADDVDAVGEVLERLGAR